jgi:NADH-quinone oxidoreductase subunit N
MLLGLATPHMDWAGLSPYLVLLGGSAVVLLATLFVPASARRPLAASVAALSFAGAFAAAVVLFVLDDAPRGLVADALLRDRLADFAMLLLTGAGFAAVGVSYRNLAGIEEPAADARGHDRVGELYALLLAAVAGMASLVAANNLMTFFLGLELFSICLYILSALAAERRTSLEAGLKYLVVGSFGSAVLLFGMALAYGGSGSIYLAEIASGTIEGSRVLVVAGLAMILVGLGFKVSAAPFHMWTPDVYQGAPTPVTAFMSAATKIAALLATLRLLTTAFPREDDLWTVVLAIVVVASLAWGNLAAIAQADLKRLLAYSSISHAGFLLMPIAAGNEIGGRALLYYLIAYGAMSIGGFAIVAARERETGQPVTVSSLAGFGWERPFYGAAMTIFMFGFIGLPPAGIFLGKFYAFAAVVERGWAWLAVVGVVATVVSIYYYGGVIRAMYMSGPRVALAPTGGSPPRDALLAGAVLVCLVVTIGSLFAADPLLEIVDDAVSTLPFPN